MTFLLELFLSHFILLGVLFQRQRLTKSHSLSYDDIYSFYYTLSTCVYGCARKRLFRSGRC